MVGRPAAARGAAAVARADDGAALVLEQLGYGVVDDLVRTVQVERLGVVAAGAGGYAVLLVQAYAARGTHAPGDHRVYVETVPRTRARGVQEERLLEHAAG